MDESCLPKTVQYAPKDTSYADTVYVPPVMPTADDEPCYFASGQELRMVGISPAAAKEGRVPGVIHVTGLAHELQERPFRISKRILDLLENVVEDAFDIL
ncbi:hypothetical protein HY493_01255 [Candidatus Woesearchaeota archaeon]|nr:hypothetical protein [Candidatus Woesearchaeota archaeon]